MSAGAATWMAAVLATFVGGHRMPASGGAGAPAAGAEAGGATQVTSPGDDAAVELQWRAPQECPGGARVRDEIARFVAAGTQTGTVDRVQVDAVIERVGEGYVLELELRLPTGALRKRIEATECAVLASAAALVMAVMLDPAAVIETVDGATPREPVPPQPPVQPQRVPAPPTQPPPAPPPIASKRAVQAIVRGSALGSWGTMPRFGAAFAGAIGARIGRARVEAIALGELPQRARHRVERDAGARVDLWSVGARGCFAPIVRKLDFPLCAGFEGGRIRARGVGLRIAERATAPWLALPFGAAILWAPIPRVAVGGGVDGWLAVTRPAFEIEDLGVVHRVSRAGVRIHAGVELRFP